MATTTNYSWTTPDDTALVKDGASAIRTLGTSIDTTTKNLNPSTTLGDIEYRSSSANTNTRLGIGTSGQGLQVVAGVPSWAASSTSTLTTTGDLLYASAANTLARRAIGSTGDVLTVSGGLPTWATPTAGGMTLISTTTLSGTSTTLSSIPQTYNSLYLVVTGMTFASGANNFRLKPNNDTTSSDTMQVFNGTASSTSGLINLGGGDNLSATDANNVWTMGWNNYTSTTRYKTYNFIGTWLNSGSTRRNIFAGGTFKSNTALTSLVFDVEGTIAFSSGTVLLYGVK
jgi:hypothetical protein